MRVDFSFAYESEETSYKLWDVRAQNGVGWYNTRLWYKALFPALSTVE